MTAARSTKGKGQQGATGPSAGARVEVGIPSVIDDLAPTARELLEAARRLFETEGYSSLTLKAIGREAGQNESLIGYHFGSKTGLLVALVDWLVYGTVRDLHTRVLRLEEGQDQLHPAMDDARKLVGDVESYRAFYDLMPHLRHPRRTPAHGPALHDLSGAQREGAVVRPRAGAFSQLAQWPPCTWRSPTGSPSRSSWIRAAWTCSWRPSSGRSACAACCPGEPER